VTGGAAVHQPFPWGAFCDVVQQRRAQKLVVVARLRQDRRDGDRVGDVRISALPVLTLVTVRGDVACAADQLLACLSVSGRAADYEAEEAGQEAVDRGAGRPEDETVTGT
jgi:hypothetical protein